MRITWDSKARAVYIELPCKSGRRVIETFKAINTELVHLDYNKANELCGVEVLNVSKPEVVDITK